MLNSINCKSLRDTLPLQLWGVLRTVLWRDASLCTRPHPPAGQVADLYSALVRKDLNLQQTLAFVDPDGTGVDRSKCARASGERGLAR